MLDAFFVKLGAAAAPPRSFLTLKEKVAWAEDVSRSITPAARHIFCAAMAEMGAIAGDLGAQCLRETVAARRPEFLAQIATLRSDYDRAIWVWVRDGELFEEVLARWFFERRRPAGAWTDAYEIPIGARLIADAFDLKGALIPVLDQHDAGAPDVAVDEYQLDDFRGDGGSVTLLSIFYEGRWNRRARIENGEVNSVAERVTHQVAVQVESAGGLMYVVSDSRSATFRQSVAHTIAQVGLGISAELEALPRQRYNLQRLLDPAEFSWDPEHCIESVCVPSLTLWAPNFGTKNQRTFSSGKDPEDVRAHAIAQLSPAQRRLAKVIKGQLRVVFAPRPGRRRRPVTFEFNGPESVKMDLDSAEQDLVRARHFDPWTITAPRRVPRALAR